VAVTVDWVYDWQNDAAAVAYVGFLKARRQLSALQAVVERASPPAAHGLAKRETIRDDRESFIVRKPYGGSKRFECERGCSGNHLMLSMSEEGILYNF
jgi:hypothetical protein